MGPDLREPTNDDRTGNFSPTLLGRKAEGEVQSLVASHLINGAYVT